ncbi:MAG TPA: hypothetical protein VFK78_00510 [Gemmatimonadales bacterium]|nr:hypothetical protein [Gemmatimonadales bacterium]
MLLAVAAGAAAQQLPVTEASVGAVAALARRDFWGASLGIARRPGWQERFGVTAAGGVFDGEPAARFEAAAQFVLLPSARTGVSPYAGLGVAMRAARARRGAAFLLASLGVESAPGARSGWYAELGLAGGVRLAVGRRWRHLPRWW